LGGVTRHGPCTRMRVCGRGDGDAIGASGAERQIGAQGCQGGRVFSRVLLTGRLGVAAASQGAAWEGGLRGRWGLRVLHVAATTPIARGCTAEGKEAACAAQGGCVRLTAHTPGLLSSSHSAPPWTPAAAPPAAPPPSRSGRRPRLVSPRRPCAGLSGRSLRLAGRARSCLAVRRRPRPSAPAHSPHHKPPPPSPTLHPHPKPHPNQSSC
jgi:hypothetical protein